jgi:LysM repeat protein
MESKQAPTRSPSRVLLDISLFVLDMLSPEKIRDKYRQGDEEFILEIPSAFLTMIADAQAGNSLLRQFIKVNLIALKNNPIHQQSSEPRIKRLVNADEETLDEITDTVQETILRDFVPLIIDISKVEQVANPAPDYPIKIYEPLVPVSQEELRNLRFAYLQELHLNSHPLFDLYFLQIYHAQAVLFSEKTSEHQYRLLSVGLSTYKTIRVWKYGIFGKFDEYGEIRSDHGIKDKQIRDTSINLLLRFVSSYFRKEWESIVEDFVGLKVDLAFVLADSGGISVEDVVIRVVTLHGIKKIAKAFTEKNSPIVERGENFIGGLLILVVICLITTTGGQRILKMMSSQVATTIDPLPTIIITFYPTQGLTETPVLPQLTPTSVEIINTSTAVSTEIHAIPTVYPDENIDASTSEYCMYVVQPGDNIQSVASRFYVSENDLRSLNKQIALNIFVVNQLIKVNNSCCAPIEGNGFIYTVKYKDDLYSIAETYSVSENAIALANNLYNPNYIQTGQMLCIPNQ